MSNNITDVIFNLKDQVLRFASPINHNHDDKYLQKETGDYAPKVHASSTIDYGKATATEYGHVKKSVTVNNDDAVPTGGAIISYITSRLNTFCDSIKDRYEDTLDSNGRVTKQGKINEAISKYNIESKLKRYSIAATYQKPNDYPVDEKFNAFEQKVQDDDGVDKYTWAGHYQITPTSNQDDYKIQYGTIYKQYANGLLDVRRSENTIIQDLYTTMKNFDGKYVLSGEKYTRRGTISGDTVSWKNWLVSYIPYSDSSIVIKTLGTGINNMVLKEVTSGYIIEWANDGAYILEASANTPHPIAKFKDSLQLHIGDTEHVFSNHLGGYQITVTKTGINLISNKQLGASIEKKFLNQTYFIPRAG